MHILRPYDDDLTGMVRYDDGWRVRKVPYIVLLMKGCIRLSAQAQWTPAEVIGPFQREVDIEVMLVSFHTGAARGLALGCKKEQPVLAHIMPARRKLRKGFQECEGLLEQGVQARMAMDVVDVVQDHGGSSDHVGNKALHGTEIK